MAFINKHGTLIKSTTEVFVILIKTDKTHIERFIDVFANEKIAKRYLEDLNETDSSKPYFIKSRLMRG
jgi:hypothetical protein